MDIHYRIATYHDYISIAQIHADSWKVHYRDILEADYLETVVDADRRQVWQQRLGHPKKNQYVVVAESEGRVIGFGCAYWDYDDKYHNYLDNLHVQNDFGGNGIGRMIMNYIAHELLSRSEQRELFLWVFEQNKKALSTYQYWGGEPLETTYLDMPSGGGGGRATRVQWMDAQVLLRQDAPALKLPPYIPIDCNLYDYLEILAMRRKKITILFHDYNQPLTDSISALNSEQKIEYLTTSKGYKIRLDRLKTISSLNGEIIVDYSTGNHCKIKDIK